MLTGQDLSQFEKLHADGMAAKDADNHRGALELFETATEIALTHDDQQKGLDAMQPAARSLWSLGRYEAATDKLETASRVAEELELRDEQGVIISNMGRIASVRTVRTIPVAEQRKVLRAEATPRFREAYSILKNHPHLYYRYANAQHGSVISALAGERRLTTRLIAEGLCVALRASDEPYDQELTYKISSGTKRGVVQMLAATVLIPLGGRTPFLAKFARNKLVR